MVLGLGSFGSALAIKLSENGCRVTGVDQNRERIEGMKDILYEAINADCTDRQALAQIMLPQAQAVFISLGESLENSLLATLHAKELGARDIWVKGLTQEHGKILEALGVQHIIYPEVETARNLADRVTWPNVLEYLPIDDEYQFAETSVPDQLYGQTLREADLRRQFGIWVLGIKDTLSNRLEIFPDGDTKLLDNHMLLLVSKKADLEKFRELQ